MQRRNKNKSLVKDEERQEKWGVKILGPAKSCQSISTSITLKINQTTVIHQWEESRRGCKYVPEGRMGTGGTGTVHIISDSGLHNKKRQS